MNWTTVKTGKDMKLDGITFDCEFHDKALSAVTLTDASGHAVRFVLENYVVRALIPAPPEKKTVHVVTGTVRGLGTVIREEFDEPYAASRRKTEIEQADVCEAVAVTTEEVEVPV